MLSIGAIAAGGAQYYVSQETLEYYSEVHANWCGRLAGLLGLPGSNDQHAVERLSAGADPGQGPRVRDLVEFG